MAKDYLYRSFPHEHFCFVSPYRWHSQDVLNVIVLRIQETFLYLIIKVIFQVLDTVHEDNTSLYTFAADVLAFNMSFHSL
jgi:hypothetical protein